MAHKLSLIGQQNVASCLWNQFNNNPYPEAVIAKIKDNIGDKEVPVTSIPSPFARLHLFETAFKYVCEQYALSNDSKAFEGRTTFHRLISDCMDVFELLFFYEELQLADKIKVVSWSTSELTKLWHSGNPGQSIFAEVLKLYIDNYNKDKRYVVNDNPFNSCDIILYDNTVIAATSPFTGFYTTANRLPAGIKNIEGVDFFGIPRPLFKRNPEFIKFINLFFHNPRAVSFPAVYKYIKDNGKFIPDAGLKNYLNGLNTGGSPDDLTNTFPILSIGGTPLQIIPGLQYRKKQLLETDILAEIKKSQYIVKTSKTLTNPPLAIPKTGGKNTDWIYLHNKPMDESTVIPTLDSRDYSDRTIPGFEHYQYPYVVRNDFLSKHIIELPYEINNDCFWMDCWKGNNEKDFPKILLPIKPDYLKFFSLEDLKKNLSIKKLQNSDAYHVSLTIPTQSGNIQFDRTYSHVQNVRNVPSEDSGAIIKAQFHMGIYPFFKVKNNKYNDLYKIAVFKDEPVQIELTFHRENLHGPRLESTPSPDTFERTREAEGLGMVSTYFELSKSIDEEDTNIQFDFVSIGISGDGAQYQGLIIPLFQEIDSLSDEESTIAFDVGTSNSHVAVSLRGGVKALSTVHDGPQKKHFHFTMLHKPVKDREEIKGSNQYDINSRHHNILLRSLQLNEFLPSIIGDKSEYAFPIRTIINQDNDCDAAKESDIHVLSSINIPFAFGNEELRKGFDNAHSNLKWDIADEQNRAAKHRLKAFIEQIMIMGRNSVLCEGINPAKTKVIWFRPLSMPPGAKSIFADSWEEVYVKYFAKDSNTHNISDVTESWAPFYSYNKSFGKGDYFVSIDIGGGTTDILAFINNKPSLTSSFRFAGNNLFDHGLVFDKPGVGLKKDNGFAEHYSKVMQKYFEDDKNEDKLLKILRYIKNNNELRSQDLISFFFSQKKFTEMLKEDMNFALLFLLHNAAIFYHSAQILKQHQPGRIPNSIGLSGNGARLLKISNKSEDLNRHRGIAFMVEHIFQHVFELKERPQVELNMLDNPKESTAIGGIIGLDQMLEDKHKDQDCFHIAVGDQETIFLEEDKDRTIKLAHELSKLRDEKTVLKRVADNYKGFITFFFDKLWLEANLPDNLGVNKSYNTVKLKKYFSNETNIETALTSVINYKIDVEGEQYLSESLFFEPLKAYLYEFSKVIANENELNKYKGN